MTTNPVVKMMHSLSNRSFEELKMTAENECITIPEHVSKVELITLTNYEAVLDVALKTGYIQESHVELLHEWRRDPAHWSV